jgi:hypothetical protein
MDNTKKFFQENKELFDHHTPDPEIKLRVFNSLGKRQKAPVLLYLSFVAATSMTVIVISFFLVQNKVSKDLLNSPLKIENDVRSSIPILQRKEADTGLKPQSMIANFNLIKKRKSDYSHTLRHQFDEIKLLQTSYISQINQQVAHLKVMPFFTHEPVSISDLRQQFQNLDEKEKNFLDTKYISNSELMNELINIYQDKLSVLIKIRLEINRINNTLPADSIILSPPHFINL